MWLSEELAVWVSRLDDERLPPEVVNSTKWRILDVLGCMLGGATHPDTQRAREVGTQTFPGQQARSIPFPEQLSKAGAAFVNGTSSLVLEFDDSHLESAIHPTSSVLSAALPAAISEGLSGLRLIGAVAVGNELACRLGVVAPGKFHQNGFHPTGIFGTFGAIYALARCLGFDTSTTADAVGMGGSLASALMASWEDGSATKSLHAGLSAASAIHAASCAQNGLSGPRAVFDGRYGFYKAHVQDKSYAFSFDRVTKSLGQDWELLNIAPKAYPCGHYIQPLIEAVRAIRRDATFGVEDIIAIRCALSENVLPLVAEPAAEKRRPKTSFHGRFSLHHSMAEALIAGDLDKSSFATPNLTDPRFNGLADKIDVVADPSATDRRQLGGAVEIALADGRNLAFSVSNMRGMPQNPMSEAELVRKFRMNADGWLNEAAVDRLLDRLVTLESKVNVRTLVDCL